MTPALDLLWQYWTMPKSCARYSWFTNRPSGTTPTPETMGQTAIDTPQLPLRAVALSSIVWSTRPLRCVSSHQKRNTKRAQLGTAKCSLSMR